MGAEAVYLACALTSLACALLLLRAYRQRRTRLLLWSSLCFAGLTVNNMLLHADFVLVPNADLALWRAASGLAAMLVLVYGLVWDAQ
jgi:cytochrome bd-type quinol oxidase subunit 2